MQFHVFDRIVSTQLSVLIPHIIISIQDPNNRKSFKGVGTTDQTLEVLNLDFHDVSSKKGYIPKMLMGIPEDQEIIYFNKKHAKKVISIYERNKDKADIVAIHCDAGMSRSPGIAAALQKIHTGNDFLWFNTKTPNMLVYRTIMEEYYADQN